MKRSIMLPACLAVTLLQFASAAAQPTAAPEAVPSEKVLRGPFGPGDEAAFVDPPKVFRPQTWFHYVGGNVSTEGITADLEAIAAAGFSGVQLFHGQAGYDGRPSAGVWGCVSPCRAARAGQWPAGHGSSPRMRCAILRGAVPMWRAAMTA